MTLALRHRILQRAYLGYSRFTRGMTLGVRAMLIRNGRVFLVKHSYVPGWHFPGGGVEAGESFGEALAREIDEEAGAELTGPARLHGLYRNPSGARRDHVALYVCRDWRIGRRLDLPSREIVEGGLFAIETLPQGVTPGTLRRIAEVIGGEAPATDW